MVNMEKLRRGAKHPTKDLIFYQYHHPFFKETNGECWLTPSEFERRKEAHRISTLNSNKKRPLSTLVSGCLSRDKQKYNTPKKDIITLDFIKELLKKQNNKCYWFNIEMDINIKSLESSRNPLKLTVDRLDCSRGYSMDNVVLCCYAANCGRGDCSVEMWLNIIKFIKNGFNEIGT